MKAVVWTDAIQTMIIVLGVIVATISAIIHAGGFGQVFEIASKYRRTDALM